ncbi:uncharacterized protein LOC133728579 [Rosa rugosa]|uniref:uncharacterized protein LOC133728579 n=1 Tax=Rosa rugosa TaxID=74645 RepID=UPI002B413AB2|nr:uncharacterized protein LOC133728579 [Rosa rugosa]
MHTIIVWNLHSGIDNKALEKEFEKYGPIRSARVFVPSIPGEMNRGVVEFQTTSAAASAICEMNRKNGWIVEYAKEGACWWLSPAVQPSGLTPSSGQTIPSPKLNLEDVNAQLLKIMGHWTEDPVLPVTSVKAQTKLTIVEQPSHSWLTNAIAPRQANLNPPPPQTSTSNIVSQPFHSSSRNAIAPGQAKSNPPPSQTSTSNIAAPPAPPTKKRK